MSQLGTLAEGIQEPDLVTALKEGQAMQDADWPTPDDDGTPRSKAALQDPRLDLYQFVGRQQAQNGLGQGKNCFREPRSQL